MRDTYVMSTDTMRVTPKSTKKIKNRTLDLQERCEKLPKYDHSKIQELIYDMERIFNRNFLNDVNVV